MYILFYSAITFLCVISVALLFTWANKTVNSIHPKYAETRQGLSGNTSSFIHNTHQGPNWLKLKHSREIYLYSAYYDDRNGLKSHYVRVIAVTEKQLETWTMYCVYGYDGTNRTKLSEPLEFIPIGVGAYARMSFFREYVVSCAYPKNDVRPSYVSLTDRMATIPNDFLPVQIPERPKVKLKFGLCMKSLYGKQDPYNIVEWMELHKILGTEEVTIYNQSMDPKSSDIVRHYAREGFVDFRQCPNPFPVEGAWYEQISMSPSINDCMYRNMYRYEKIQVTDIDEIIVPGNNARNYSGIHSMIISFNLR